MTRIEQVEDDLRFVRGALAASAMSKSPAPVYFLWAAAVLAGFLLMDIDRALVGPYWMVVGPAGFAASAYLGWHRARTRGQVSTADGKRHLLHWGSVLVAIALALLMPGRGVLSWEALNGVILLILAVGYFTAGVHGEPPLLWIGLLMAGGYVLVTLASSYAWSILGVVLAIALAGAGVREGRSSEAGT